MKIAIIGAVLLCLASMAGAQVAPPGEIAARITEDCGAAIPGVTVTLISNDGKTYKKLAITPADGTVRFTDVPAGDYSLRFELSGFMTQTLGPFPVRYSKNGPDLPQQLHVHMVAGPIWY